jgi:hypothetical protein
MDKSQKSADCTQWEDEPLAVITDVTQQALTEMAKSWGAKGKTHEYLTDLATMARFPKELAHPRSMNCTQQRQCARR